MCLCVVCYVIDLHLCVTYRGFPPLTKVLSSLITQNMKLVSFPQQLFIHSYELHRIIQLYSMTPVLFRYDKELNNMNNCSATEQSFCADIINHLCVYVLKSLRYIQRWKRSST